MSVTEIIFDSLSAPTTTAATKVKTRPKNLRTASNGHLSLLLPLSKALILLPTPFICCIFQQEEARAFQPEKGAAFGVNKKWRNSKQKVGENIYSHLMPQTEINAKKWAAYKFSDTLKGARSTRHKKFVNVFTGHLKRV